MGESLEVSRIYLQVQLVAVAVEEYVGGKFVDVQITLDGVLLLVWQIVVGNVWPADVILLDDVLIRVLWTLVG